MRLRHLHKGANSVSAPVSNFHLSKLTVMRKRFKKFQPRVIHCRKRLSEKLSKEVLINHDIGFQRFCDINITTLNEHAPTKKIYA